VVMIVAQQDQIGECIVLDLLVEFPRPFGVAEEVRVALIERPEAGIGFVEQFLLRRPLNLSRGTVAGENQVQRLRVIPESCFCAVWRAQAMRGVL
jgi:hypothetical protein